MPVRTRKNRRRRTTHITQEAVDLFRRGVLESDPYKLRDIKIALADALARSKYAANPLDCKPRSLIGCDREPAEVALGLRAELLKAIGKGRMAVADVLPD
jgi:hypothetical protein